MKTFLTTGRERNLMHFCEPKNNNLKVETSAFTFEQAKNKLLKTEYTEDKAVSFLKSVKKTRGRRNI